MTRRQCAKCPWKKSTDPNEIPNGYCADKHRNLAETIAPEGAPLMNELRIMACHETHEEPCVGWQVQQAGPGNNILLRMSIMSGRIDGDVETVGPQHQTFEETLP